MANTELERKMPRTKEEITEDNDGRTGALMIIAEILTDIRDLLAKQKN